MWDWVTDVASTAWDWATDNAGTIYNASKGFVEDRISNAEQAALTSAQRMSQQKPPSLSQYGTSPSRSIAGVSTFSDIKEASGTKYAQFLYYTRSYLQTKAKYQGTVPSVTFKKSGLGSKS